MKRERCGVAFLAPMAAVATPVKWDNILKRSISTVSVGIDRFIKVIFGIRGRAGFLYKMP